MLKENELRDLVNSIHQEIESRVPNLPQNLREVISKTATAHLIGPPRCSPLLKKYTKELEELSLGGSLSNEGEAKLKELKTALKLLRVEND
jgi:hypothetical protein